MALGTLALGMTLFGLVLRPGRGLRPTLNYREEACAVLYLTGVLTVRALIYLAT